MVAKVLVVEDTPSIRRIIAHLLRGRGHEVLEAAEGRDAWEKATTQAPDLVVLDAMLPGKTGFEICTQLKRDNRWKHIPVLMLTAVAREEGDSPTRWREKSGADQFLPKPFKTSDLLACVEHLLATRTKPPQSSS